MEYELAFGNEMNKMLCSMSLNQDDFDKLGIEPEDIISSYRERKRYDDYLRKRKGQVNVFSFKPGTELEISPDGTLKAIRNIIEKPEPRRIYVSRDWRVTVVIWKDGTKTVARCSDADVPDLEKGIWAAIVKKVYGPRSRYKRLFDCVEFQE